jgi:isopentenyl-diphosphate delta-isomerase
MTTASRELVDLVDELGHTVQVVTRAEMRARGLPHRCTYILVFNRRGELFVHLRTATKDVFPEHWDVTVGGVLAAGESYDAGARREVSEELGIDCETAMLERLFPFRYSDDCTTVHGMAYRMVHDGPFRLQAEEIVQGEFTTVDAALARAAYLRFCPDGLAVLKELMRSGPVRRDS